MNDSAQFTEAVKVMQEAVASGTAPGAALLVGRSNEILFERGFGRLSYREDAAPATVDTIYDLASLTKVLVTTTLAMLFYDRGTLELDAAVRRHIAEFAGEDKDRVSVRDLLAHCGGLLWWSDLYRRCEGRSRSEAKRCYLDAICALPLDYPPRSRAVYSDLGFLLLGEILEQIGGKALDALAEEQIFAPLGMTYTAYRPRSTWLARIAPTERDPWRGRVVHGEVHDENAFGLGGVAPHSGVFSSARDLAPFPQMLLNAGMHEGNRLIGAETVALFTARANLVAGSSRALGWDTPFEGGSCGRHLSARSFGHTGFTGTSLWIDPARDLFVILLTNRVHPTRDNRRIIALRQALHDAVALELTA